VRSQHSSSLEGVAASLRLNDAPLSLLSPPPSEKAPLGKSVYRGSAPPSVGGSGAAFGIRGEALCARELAALGEAKKLLFPCEPLPTAPPAREAGFQGGRERVDWASLGGRDKVFGAKSDVGEPLSLAQAPASESEAQKRVDAFRFRHGPRAAPDARPAAGVSVPRDEGGASALLALPDELLTGRPPSLPRLSAAAAAAEAGHTFGVKNRASEQPIKSLIAPPGRQAELIDSCTVSFAEAEALYKAAGLAPPSRQLFSRAVQEDGENEERAMLATLQKLMLQ
jgi:hypothetical protein